MFPEQRKIPMVGIYGSFWTWLHEYMNKRSKKTGFEAAKQEHRMHRIVQYIAASTILTVEDIENYLMMKPNCSKNYTNKCNFERGESYKPTQVVDKLLKNEANLTNIFITIYPFIVHTKCNISTVTSANYLNIYFHNYYSPLCF